MVDERKLAFNPAVEVSYLKRDEQRMLLEAMDAEQTTPSLSQAQRLKKFSQEGRLTEEDVYKRQPSSSSPAVSSISR